MGYPARIYYVEKDKALMWDRWQKGESLNAIARHFGRGHSLKAASRERQVLADTLRAIFQCVTAKSDRAKRPKPQNVTELIPE